MINKLVLKFFVTKENSKKKKKQGGQHQENYKVQTNEEELLSLQQQDKNWYTMNGESRSMKLNIIGCQIKDLGIVQASTNITTHENEEDE